METTEKVRIEELSIGDWVQDILGNICIVRNIFCGDLVECYVIEKGDELSIMIDRLRPIPITSEVLEGNGLMRVTEEEDYEAYCCNDFLIRRSKFSCTDWWQVDVHYKQYVAHLSGYIQYVHHLQHLLTINECDKKIEL